MKTFYTEPSVTGKDKTIWKILFSNIAGFKYTPYMGIRVRNCQLDGSKPLTAKGVTDLEYSKGVLSVRSGFIHCYENIEKALEDMPLLQALGRKFSYTPVIFRCTVKEGTPMYRDGLGEIAVKELWFENEIDTDDLSKIFGFDQNSWKNIPYFMTVNSRKHRNNHLINEKYQ